MSRPSTNSRKRGPTGRVLVAADYAGREATEQVRQLEGGGGRLLRLPHPRTATSAAFLLSGGALQEMNVSRPTHASWFVGQSVVEDGGLWLATPVDPLFLLLPLLEAARGANQGKPDGVFVNVDEALVNDQFPDLHVLARLTQTQGQLDCICEKKELGSCTYYRLQDAHVNAWLDLKVAAAKAGVKASPSASLASLEGPELDAYAVGLLSEYLPVRWQEQLSTRWSVAKAPQSKNAEAAGQEGVAGGKWAEAAAKAALEMEKAERENIPANKRPKIMDRAEMAKERAKERARAVKAEAKALQIKRETRGMASIASLFAKKQSK